jgi:hypothetical protein
MRSLATIPGQGIDAPIFSVQVHIDRLVIKRSADAAPLHEPAHLFRFDVTLKWRGEWLVSGLG